MAASPILSSLPLCTSPVSKDKSSSSGSSTSFISGILIIKINPKILKKKVLLNRIVFDGGNSHFDDTDRRYKFLKGKNINFIGAGVSGGSKGARIGPSIMPGCDKDIYDEIKPIFEAASAKVNGDPCVTYLGNTSSGHYVKMIHNGIEYAIMQLISENYHVLKYGLKLDNNNIHSGV